jgi:SAM-dependent methyltransferase
LQAVDVKLDLDARGLAVIEAESQDFAVFANGIQQVANPILSVEQLFRVTRPGGHVVLSVPDRRFSPEASRPLTLWTHVLEEYLQGVTTVSDAHYVDLLFIYAPKVLYEGVSAIEPRLKEFRRRAEHAHVWDTQAFREFLTRALRVCDIEAELVAEVTGDESLSEYLAVYRKTKQMLE